MGGRYHFGNEEDENTYSVASVFARYLIESHKALLSILSQTESVLDKSKSYSGKCKNSLTFFVIKEVFL